MKLVRKELFNNLAISITNLVVNDEPWQIIINGIYYPVNREIRSRKRELILGIERVILKESENLDEYI